jgi:hypothetical protein
MIEKVANILVPIASYAEKVFDGWASEKIALRKFPGWCKNEINVTTARPYS